MVKRFTVLILMILFTSCIIPVTARADIKLVDETEVFNWDTGEYEMCDVYSADTVEDIEKHILPYMIKCKDIPFTYRITRKLYEDVTNDLEILRYIDKGYPSSVVRSYFNSCRWSNFSDDESDTDLIDATFNFSFYSTEEKEQYVNKRTDEIIKSLKLDGLTDYAKIKKIYKWVIDNNKYAYDKNGRPDANFYIAYDVFKYGKSVCAGYASTLSCLLDKIGIRNKYVGGYGLGAPHGWNVIEIEGKWYLADATWDDSKGSWRYFLKGTDSFYKDHTPDEKYKSIKISKQDYVNKNSEKMTLPTKVKLPGNVEIKEGKTYNLKKGIKKNYTIISSNPKVARVTAKNNIKGVSEGLATITVKYGLNTIGAFDVTVVPKKKTVITQNKLIENSETDKWSDSVLTGELPRVYDEYFVRSALEKIKEKHWRACSCDECVNKWIELLNTDEKYLIMFDLGVNLHTIEGNGSTKTIIGEGSIEDYIHRDDTERKMLRVGDTWFFKVFFNDKQIKDLEYKISDNIAENPTNRFSDNIVEMIDGKLVAVNEGMTNLEIYSKKLNCSYKYKIAVVKDGWDF